jgi:hypothetical protein
MTAADSSATREERRLRTLTTPRSAGLAGVVFAVLFGLSMVLLRMSITEAPLTDTELSSVAKTRLTIALTLMPRSRR